MIFDHLIFIVKLFSNVYYTPFMLFIFPTSSGSIEQKMLFTFPSITAYVISTKLDKLYADYSSNQIIILSLAVCKSVIEPIASHNPAAYSLTGN